MRLIEIEDMPLGNALGQALFNERGDVLAQVGVILNAQLVESIKARGYTAVVVDDAQSEGIELVDPLTPETRARATKTAHETTAVGEQTAMHLGPDRVEHATYLPRSNEIQRLISQTVPADAVFESANSITEEVMDAPTLLGLNSIKSQDSFAYTHAVEVASVAVMLGRKLGLKQPDLKRLGRGALLHDIGQVFTGDTTDGKSGAISSSDIEQINRHTRLGYDFLQNVPDFDVLMNHVAYQHHEWFNGKGYPRGLVGSAQIDRDTKAEPGQILLLALVTSVADVYDALCSDRPFRARLPREMAMSLIKRMTTAQLHVEMVRLFFEIVPVFPTGYPVRIMGGTLDRWQGVVAKLGHPDLNRPVVRLFIKPDGSEVDPFEVDLAKDSVARLMTAPPRRRRENET